MAEESKSMPVNTFIALGVLIGLFFVFQGWRDSDNGEATDDSRIERPDNQTQIPPSQPRAGKNERLQPEAPTRRERHAGQLWEQPWEGVYCLNADCRTIRVSPGASLPCENDACPTSPEGMICIEGDCKSYAHIQENIDFTPAANRISRRIKELVSYRGPVPSQPYTLELMMDDYGNVHSAKTVISSGDNTYDRAVRNAAISASPFTELRGAQPHTRSLLQLIHINIEP